MWLKKFSSLLVAACTLSAQGGLDSMLAGFEAQLSGGAPAAPQLQNNITALSNGLQRNDWSDPNARMQTANRALAYLNRARQFSGGNLGLGLSLAGAYRQVGSLQYGGPYSGWIDPQGAFASYRNSFFLLSQLQGQFPGNGQVLSEMRQVRRQIEVVQAKLPELPKLDWTALDLDSQKEMDQILERYISVSATVESARVTVETMRQTFAEQGLAMRPEMIAGATRMKLKIEDAKRLIEQRKLPLASERLGAAEAEARKLLSSLGG
jgi:hypothetical protein